MKGVAIIMGSASDRPVMELAKDFLDELAISNEIGVVSAHRTPEKMFQYAKTVHERCQIVIAGAGGAAHLPGMVAALTHLPVIGVPIKSGKSLDGWDSILSILQMPPGVPVATMALNGSKNAAIFAAKILALHSPEIAERLAIKLEPPK
jgi:5-(carboxyamino)imidazole ribonucleotide mutase